MTEAPREALDVYLRRVPATFHPVAGGGFEAGWCAALEAKGAPEPLTDDMVDDLASEVYRLLVKRTITRESMRAFVEKCAAYAAPQAGWVRSIEKGSNE